MTGGQVYTQVADRLREQIVAGEFPPGGVLPSEAQLCTKFGVARNTVRRGLALLEDEGLITTVPSKGRLVAALGEQPAPYRYLSIAAELRARIQSGELPPGGALPSEARLRRRYGASRTTVRQALAVLEREGLVVARHGRGRFVRPSA
ncbi:GntR family transcriptional regulator [Nonomuraea terrae]|uniref:GntR family transcriptional regulator n=1 Tax=Nonomuraea terrae TaxID=2530383 RepID=UPI001FE278B6|nr:GntR family transcriptional regulator [Nonomuraea terrae]